VIPTSGSRSSDTKRQAGVVVEDYADTVIDNSELERDWALRSADLLQRCGQCIPTTS